MQIDRLLARLSVAAAPLALLLGATPAAAQDAAESVVTEPLPMFRAVCLGGGARLSRKDATEVSVATLPDPARRALGKTLATTKEDAARLGLPAPAAVPNTTYQVAAGALYLLVPSGTPVPGATLADSCVVLWQSSGEEDYLQARKILLPDEESVPLYMRPNSTPNGFIFATSTTDSEHRLTLATYGGWIALRSSADTPSR